MRGPPNYSDFDEDDPPFLLGIEEGGVTVWRLLLDYRFMDSKYFDEFMADDGDGGFQWTRQISAEILAWLSENDPEYSLDVVGRDAFVVHFTSEIPAMGFRLRFDASIAADNSVNRGMFGVRPDDEIDHSATMGA